MLTTKQQPATANPGAINKDKVKSAAGSGGNESLSEMTTRRSVRQSTASPLATPASNTRGAARYADTDVNRRKTRSGAGEFSY